MKKIIYISIVFLAFANSIFAQADLPITNDAVLLVEAGKLLDAEKKIQTAVVHKDEKDAPYTWYVKGFIEKEIYKTFEANQRESEHRKLSVQSIEKSLALDTKRQYTEMSNALLRYIAVSYFNDALKRAEEITKASAQEPEQLYGEFRRIMRLVNPLTNFEEYDKQIFKILGQSHYRIWEDNIKDQSEALISNDYFQRVLIIDPDDCDAILNLVILHYNQGVFKIRSIDINTDIGQLIPIQDSAIRNFMTALPYAEKCFRTCPPSVESYKGLMYCNRAIGKEELYLELKNDLEQKIRSGEIKTGK